MERPRDIWVFRSVLDAHPRIVTIALNESMWIAYDATNCGMFKVWKGGVKLEGAVYNAVHGPQPKSFGHDYWKGLPNADVWEYVNGEDSAIVYPVFRGYRFVNNQVTLQYEFTLKGKKVWVYETPEFIQMGLRVGIERTFVVQGIQSGALRLKITPPDDVSATVQSNGVLTWIDGEDVRKVGMLTLLSKGSTVLTATFREPQATFFRLHSVFPFFQADHEPGLAMRLYYIGEDLSSIPILLVNQTPNYSVVIPQVDLRGPSAFGNFSEQFYVKLTGYLRAPEAGEYEFRLTSDDGSRLLIEDKIVVDNDGLHSEQSLSSRLWLDAGVFPIIVEYFENKGDEVLRLEWRRPGKTHFEIISSDFLSTPAGEVRVTSPGKKLVADPYRKRRPGDGRPLESVHPAYTLRTIRPPNFQPRVGGISFLKDGRMVICTWDPDGAVYLLDGVTGDADQKVVVKRIASGLAEPLGIAVVNDEIYVLQKQELTRLIDHDGDEIIDEYYAVAGGWGVTHNFHEFAFGLVFHEGYFYGTLAIAIDPGGKSTQPQNADRGSVIKISRDGSYTLIARGLRTPNGIGIGPGNRIFVTDNQGDWLPSSKVLYLTPGAFYGSRAVNPDQDSRLQETPPVVWLPQGEIGNSPSQPAALKDDPYAGQLIHGDVTHGGLKRVFIEEFDGKLQGCVFRFTQGLEAGINRVVIGPDGAIYVGGIGSTGNWGQEGKERFGLQRLSFNRRVPFEPLAIRAFENGFEVELTKPLMKGMGESTADYRVEQWRYLPTADYGGPKMDHEIMKPKGISISKDRKKIFIELDNLKAGHVVYIRLASGLSSESDEILWTTEGWYTLNEIPRRRHEVMDTDHPINQLTEEEKREGFELLFDGKSMDQWRGWRRDDLPRGWAVANGLIAFTPGTDGGDIATREEYSDFELRLDWMVEPGGNSGIFFRASEERNYPWETGPEMQVLDDLRHPDGRNEITSAGSDYAMHARSRDVVRPAWEWNEVRIIAKGKEVSYWLNGYKVVEYIIGSEDWNRRKAASKFATMPDYGMKDSGRIVLQDHGDRVWYRNIRIRRL